MPERPTTDDRRPTRNTNLPTAIATELARAQRARHPRHARLVDRYRLPGQRWPTFRTQGRFETGPISIPVRRAVGLQTSVGVESEAGLAATVFAARARRHGAIAAQGRKLASDARIAAHHARKIGAPSDRRDRGELDRRRAAADCCRTRERDSQGDSTAIPHGGDDTPSAQNIPSSSRSVTDSRGSGARRRGRTGRRGWASLDGKGDPRGRTRNLEAVSERSR